MGYKPIIEIDKQDKNRYRILNGLAKNREYLIKNGINQGSDEHSLLISIGHKTRKLKLEHPIIWHSANHVKDNGIRLLKLPPEVELEEKQGNNKIFFKFKHRRVI